MNHIKTTIVGISQLILGITAFVIWSLGNISTTELIGTITFITAIGSIVGQMFSADGDKTAVSYKANRYSGGDVGGDGPSQSERDIL